MKKKKKTSNEKYPKAYEKEIDPEEEYESTQLFLVICKLLNTFRDSIIEIIPSFQISSEEKNKEKVIEILQKICVMEHYGPQFAEYLKTVGQFKSAKIMQENLSQLRSEAAFLLFFYAFKVRRLFDESPRDASGATEELKN